jgi:hypothetical protein
MMSRRRTKLPGEAAASHLAARLCLYLRTVPIFCLIFFNAPVDSKEAVIFEQIGQLAGVTATYMFTLS